MFAAPFHDVFDGSGFQGGCDARGGPLPDQRAQAEDQARDAVAGFLTLQGFPLAKHGLQNLGAAHEMFARADDVDTTAVIVRLEGGPMAVLTGTRQNGVGYDHRTEVIGSRDSVSAIFEPSGE